MDYNKICFDPIFSKLFENERHALETLKGDHIVNSIGVFIEPP